MKLENENSFHHITEYFTVSTTANQYEGVWKIINILLHLCQDTISPSFFFSIYL